MRIQTLHLVLAVLIISLSLGACGAEATPTSPPPTPTPIPPTSTPTPLPPTATPIPANVSISGVITNLDEARPYLTEASYLQLVDISDGEVTFVYPREGGVLLESELAQIPIPPDGIFSFQVDRLEPGEYFIAAQKFNPRDWMRHNAMVLAKEAGDPKSVVMIEIGDDVALPFRFDMGEVVMILP